MDAATELESGVEDLTDGIVNEIADSGLPELDSYGGSPSATATTCSRSTGATSSRLLAASVGAV